MTNLSSSVRVISCALLSLVLVGPIRADARQMQTFLGDSSAKVGMEVSAGSTQHLDKTGAKIRGKATGFFHAERIGDRWWVIDPQGNAFYIIGTDHVNYNVHWCEKLGYAPYHKNCERIYGSEEKWADHAVERLMSWGFNSLAANNSPSTRHKGLAHMEFLGMGSSFAGVDYITQRTTWTGFPNVFSPKFERFCDQMAKKQCAPQKDDPWLIGYFIDNELEWFGKTGSLFNDTFTRPADHSAKIALVNLLRTRYRDDVPAFNKTWGMNIAAFDDLLKLSQAPKPGSPKAEADVLAYVRLVADKYFAVTSAAIRKHDPNHMVFGCRFAGSAPDVWEIAGKYCDIVSVNCYRTVDLEKGILADGFESDLATWHNKTKRPLMLTEWSFPALDAGLPSVHGAGQRVRTQKDRARAFTIFQKLLFSTPFMVGSDYFMWVDEPELGISSTFPEDSNYGLVDVNDKTYELLTQAATKLHARAYDIHCGNVADVYAKPAGKRGTFIIGNRGKADARCKTSLWVDGELTERSMDIPGGESRRIESPGERTSAPGGHLLVCRVEQEDSLTEPNPADNEATELLYVPGLPGSGTRIPIIVANPTDKLVENAPVMLNLKSTTGLSLVRAENGRQSAVSCQVVAGGVLFTIDKLEPRTCATLFAYPGASSESASKGAVSYRRAGNGFEVDNGVLKLVKLDSETGNAFDRVEFRGVEMGSFHPLIHQRVGQDFWVRPTAVENIEAHNGSAALVLDMTFLFDGGKAGTITEVGKEGKPAEVVSRPHKYRAKYRFTVYPGKPYFASRFLWVENTDDEPWLLQSYFHYAPSNIAGNSSNDKPKLKYWLDAKANLCYGVEAPRGFNVSMWKDEAGAEHPDVYRYPNLERALKPGERFASDDSPVYVISGDEDSFARTADEVRTSSGLLIKVCR